MKPLGIRRQDNACCPGHAKYKKKKEPAKTSRHASGAAASTPELTYSNSTYRRTMTPSTDSSATPSSPHTTHASSSNSNTPNTQHPANPPSDPGSPAATSPPHPTAASTSTPSRSGSSKPVTKCKHIGGDASQLDNRRKRARLAVRSDAKRSGYF